MGLIKSRQKNKIWKIDDTALWANSFCPTFIWSLWKLPSWKFHLQASKEEMKSEAFHRNFPLIQPASQPRKQRVVFSKLYHLQYLCATGSQPASVDIAFCSQKKYPLLSMHAQQLSQLYSLQLANLVACSMSYFPKQRRRNVEKENRSSERTSFLGIFLKDFFAWHVLIIIMK